MMFSWMPPTPVLAGAQAPRVLHVLYEFDGPKMVIAVDETERQVIGIAADESDDAEVTRWLFAPLPPEFFPALLDGTRTLRDIFADQQVRVVDLDRQWTPTSQWNVDGSLLPEALLPEVEAHLPELTPEFRARLVAEQASRAEQRSRVARTRLLFGGKPVVGRQAISADFAAEALGKYQKLVSVTYGARVRGELRSQGPIPDRESSTLFLADMPRGSVGFELVELPAQAPSSPSLLAEVVSDVGELIESAASGDQEFAEAIAEFDPRVHPALRDFFGALKKAEASFRLEVRERRYVFDVERVRVAAERTVVDPHEELERPIPGVLLGYLPQSRRFEFRNDANEILRGRISRELDLNELREWVDKPSIAHMRIVTVYHRGSGETQAFTLLRMTPRRA
jgi:hypothetical protein